MASSSRTPSSTPPPRTSSLQFSAAIDLFTPERKEKLNKLKRKASQLSRQAVPNMPKLYLAWKKRALESEIAVRKHLRESARESFKTKGGMDRQSYESLRSLASQEQYELEEELEELLSQNAFLEQGMQDMFNAEDSLIDMVYRDCRLASEAGSKDPDLKRPKTASRNKFKSDVEEFLGATQGSGQDKERFCSVISSWFEAESVKCAHIVPHSLDSYHLAHLFGAGDAALSTKRNGLLLYRSIEKAFDSFSMTIVPHAPFILGKPPEWKVVILNPAILDATYYTELVPGKKSIGHKFRELDGRRLEWNNANRPARRYLYFRFLMAWIHADKKNFEGFKSKLPSGVIWASPEQEQKYLRRGLMTRIAERVRDTELPDDLLDSGTFEDTTPPTGNSTVNSLAGLDLAPKIEKYMKAKDEAETGSATDD